MIIGISGKKQVGKDTVATIIKNLAGNHWENKKFGSGLKDIVCLLLNCTREDLEDEVFRNKELGKEWWYYKHIIEGKILSLDEGNRIIGISPSFTHYYTLIKPTPRLLMQLVGTDCGRNIIHPNIWVNMLMKEYVPIDRRTIQDPDDSNISMPDWAISDIRFPNEIDAVKKENGIIIRILRETNYIDNHDSETALDNYGKWDYVVDNNGSISDLERAIEKILIELKIIPEDA